MTNQLVEAPGHVTLLARARAGDAEAFCRLVEPLEERLLRQAAALCRDPAAAEDLAEETLLEAWKSLARYNESCRFTTWLYAILLHRHQKAAWRARRRPIPLAWLSRSEEEQHRHGFEQVAEPALSPAERLSQDELAAEIRRAVQTLPRKHRAVVLLRFFEDASLADIAVVLNCPVGTVKSRLHHALDKLRKMNLNLSETTGDTRL
jgi:RNA polymerase sigma-70 factor (ECF subfamily)